MFDLPADPVHPAPTVSGLAFMKIRLQLIFIFAIFENKSVAYFIG
jgi:hypothetical protein